MSGAPAPTRVLGFAGFRRRVVDLRRAVEFYRAGLGFEVDDGDDAGAASADPTTARLTLGRQTIELVADAGVESVARAARGGIDTAFQHIAIVTADMAAATARLQRFAPVALSSDGPVTLPASAGGVTAFKFLDPDGHPLELIHFPAGSGASAWQRTAARGPTLGFDHSAIVVADVARSIAFYRDTLGFSVAARQVNHGPEQGRLDGMAGVVVDVVALRPADVETPHLELLAYRAPVPRAQRSSRGDLLSWRVADGVSSMVAGSVEVVDPDGHRHRLIASRIADR